MKVIWCWRCKMDIPMLEPDEAERVFAAQNRGLVTLDPESFRRIHEEFAGNPDGLQRRLEFEREWGAAPKELVRCPLKTKPFRTRVRSLTDQSTGWPDALREYERITGFHETNPMAPYHHKVWMYGPPASTVGSRCGRRRRRCVRRAWGQ